MDSRGKSLKGKSPINNKPEKEDGFPITEGGQFSMHSFLKKSREDQAMDSPGKLFTVEISMQAPINNKPEKDGFPITEGGQFSMRSFLKKSRENQAMDSPERLFTVKIPAQAPINNKPEK